MLNNIWKLKQTELKGKYLPFTHERYKKKINTRKIVNANNTINYMKNKPICKHMHMANIIIWIILWPCHRDDSSN